MDIFLGDSTPSVREAVERCQGQWEERQQSHQVDPGEPGSHWYFNHKDFHPTSHKFCQEFTSGGKQGKVQTVMNNSQIYVPLEVR